MGNLTVRSLSPGTLSVDNLKYGLAYNGTKIVTFIAPYKKSLFFKKYLEPKKKFSMKEVFDIEENKKQQADRLERKISDLFYHSKNQEYLDVSNLDEECRESLLQDGYTRALDWAFQTRVEDFYLMSEKTEKQFEHLFKIVKKSPVWADISLSFRGDKGWEITDELKKLGIDPYMWFGADHVFAKVNFKGKTPKLIEQLLSVPNLSNITIHQAYSKNPNL